MIIDEAAAIPLPYVKSMLGPYLVFLASTINGFVFHMLLYLNIIRHIMFGLFNCYFSLWLLNGFNVFPFTLSNLYLISL